MLKKNGRCSSKVRERYSKEARCYLQKNTLAFIQKISDGILSETELTHENAKIFLGKDYPIAPWVDETDAIGQLLCILKEAGYIFTYSKNGRVILKNQQLYNAIVKNHLKFSGAEIIDKLAYYCERTHGRLTYNQVSQVLGFHYPKPPYIGKTDERVCIIAFLKEVGIPFNFDENHVYFP